MALLEIDDLTVRFRGIAALDGAGLHVEGGSLVGLIGPNGAGKTTVFNCLTRLYEPERGRVSYDGHDLLQVPVHALAAHGIARTFQNLGLFPSLSVRENVMVGGHHRGHAGFATAPFRTRRLRREEAALAERADALCARLDLTDVADRPPHGLPYGTLKRVELARALASEPRLLLLDEPANGLSHAEVDELADVIRGVRRDFALTAVVVEHHMGFVMGLCDPVVCLHLGRVIAEGPPDVVKRHPDVVEAYLGAAA